MALQTMEGTTMCWTTHDRRMSQVESNNVPTKKDEGEAFRTGKTGDTPKPLPKEAPKDKELADAT